MTVDEITNKLLYVPFNEDYKVNEEIKMKLTEEEFFGKCFQKPDFDEDIQNALRHSSDEVADFEIDMDKIELAERLDRHKEESSALESWIESKQTDLYCIRGDAGTGKTTYLHYLRYKYTNKGIDWNIIDIQDAVEGVRFLGYQVDIPEFNTLYSKTIAAILLNISKSCFVTDENNRFQYEDIRTIFDNTIKQYKLMRDRRPPRIEVDDFYNGIIEISNKNQHALVCEIYAKFMSSYFDELLNENNKIDLVTKFSIVLEMYVYFICCRYTSSRSIIALDNFERFVGTDEIFNQQLIEFITNLRRIQKTIANNNCFLAQKYQVMLLMRNTTIRMFISQQATEFFEHSVDLTDWFDASSVLKNKIKWYKDNGIDVLQEKHLLSILDDMGECGGSLRGLHFKISMLFNYNKRIIIKFLAKILTSSVNQAAISKYDMFWKNEYNLPMSLNKFAARSIIYRLVLNALRKDGFFENIIVQKDNKEEDNTDFTGSGYARKILTILHERTVKSNEKSYVPLKDLIVELFPNTHSAVKKFLDGNNSVNLDRIAKVLYYMNYYDGRNSNWLQFIDIQYANMDKSTVNIDSPKELKTLIKNNFEDINIKITNAGKAYLFFVVYYFEYFSCKSIGFAVHKELFGEKDMPPLLCTIPSLEEIEKNKADDLTCIKILRVVSHEALTCISNMDNDVNNKKILFRYKCNSIKLEHKERIINSHIGYIDNFINCIEHLYRKEGQLPEKVFALIKEIVSIREEYKDFRKCI